MSQTVVTTDNNTPQWKLDLTLHNRQRKQEKKEEAERRRSAARTVRDARPAAASTA